ncbi:C2 family cysteine protease [Streptomyces sp. VNUA24]|uniref:C2 family cysteine protease n=1 Tax=Streptomyces sp. VNUA24 TaxID=3031131 RepID=UPI0023B830A7|nr:C2 family cysteine protease [Streptomyces sp. VNUA24]WEH15930.1 C2 family cysteine protease [Streptomyces sp. VNUA24]
MEPTDLPPPIEATEDLDETATPETPDAAVPRDAPDPSEAPAAASGDMTPAPPEASAPGPATTESDSAPEPHPVDSEVPTEPAMVEQPTRTDMTQAALSEAPDPFEAEEPDDTAEGGFLDWAHDVFSHVGKPADVPVPKEATIDRPDFNNVDLPGIGPLIEYGTPLDRPDGTRLPLFDGPPAREQTQQGMLNDCGVIATMGAVAGHRPELISQCVRENDDGTYEVTLHQTTYAPNADSWRLYQPTGAVTTLSVTPDLPTLTMSSESPVFATSGNSEVAWPSILEKAIAGVDQTWSEDRAKPSSGYARLDRGSNPNVRAELLTQLTGEPAYTQDFPTRYDPQGRSPDRQLLDTFREKLVDGHPILVGTIAIQKDSRPLPHGLIEKHAYELTEVDDRGLIHLRDPHNGADPDPLSVKEFRKHLKNRYTTTE